MIANRERKIVQTSLIGIVGNVLLVGAKAVIGFLANSISIITDAVNNLSDALSSLITIIGTKLANRRPDKKHPYGHGRVEYLTSIVISVIILIAGVTAIYQSIMTLIEKREPDYDVYSIVVIALAIVVKIGLGLYFRFMGKKLESGPLKASGKDALFDASLSVATIIGIITSLIWKVNIEGYIGIVIGLFILRSGFEILKDGVSLIIGERPEQEFINKVKGIVCSFEEVQGAYDLIVNNYGANKSIASVHIEVDDDLKASQIHHLSRQIAEKVYLETGAIISIGIYAKNEGNEEIKTIKSYILEKIKNDEDIKQLHGFYVDFERKLITFDLVINFSCADPKNKIKIITEDLKNRFPEYSYGVVIDNDFSD